jgi:hypothetical protein
MTILGDTRTRAPWLIVGAALLGLMARPAAAQITIDPTTAAPDAVWVSGQAWPGHVTTPVKNDGGVISFFYSNSWIEIPFAAEQPGIYELTIPVYSPEQNLRAQAHVRAADSNLMYATDSFAVPTTGDWGAVQNVMVSGIPILQAGPHILRFANTKFQHHTAENREPALENEPGEGGPGTGGPRFSGFNFGIMTLTRTGDLPGATGTISGTVVSADQGGIPVVNAFVMASTGEPVGEPGPLWQKGFWSRTDADGAYSLTVLPNTYNVQAGQPSMYAMAGAISADVTVAAGATAPVNLNLPSRWTRAEDGRHSLQVESEYFVAKVQDTFSTNPGEYRGSPVVVQGRPFASNSMNAGYLDFGNYIDLPVEVPAGQAGAYTVENIFFNGFWDGANYLNALTRFTANPGTAQENHVQAVEPNTTPRDEFGNYVGPPDTGYSVQGRVVYPEPLTLREGHNIIRISSHGTFMQQSSSAWDAFVLTQVNVPAPGASAARALRLAGGLQAPEAGDMEAHNVVTTGDSANQVDLLDAVELAKQGRM